MAAVDQGHLSGPPARSMQY